MHFDRSFHVIFKAYIVAIIQMMRIGISYPDILGGLEMAQKETHQIGVDVAVISDFMKKKLFVISR